MPTDDPVCAAMLDLLPGWTAVGDRDRWQLLPPPGMDPYAASDAFQEAAYEVQQARLRQPPETAADE